MASLIEYMNTQVSTVFSLANAVKRCDSTDTFESIIEKPLREVGIDLDLVEVNEEAAKASLLRGTVTLVEGERKKSATVRTTRKRPNEISPSRAAEELAALPGLLVIDEADAIAVAADRHKLAEFIKHLSDSSAKLKVLSSALQRPVRT